MSLVELSYDNGAAAKAASHELVEQVSPAAAITNILRHRWLIAVTTLLIGVPAISYILVLPPYYDASALLLIDTKHLTSGDSQFANTEPGGVTDAIAISTQVDIIKSPAMAETVVDRLDLTHNQEFERALQPRRSLSLVTQAVIARLNGMNSTKRRELTTVEKRQLTASLLSGKVTITNGGKSYLVEIRARTNDANLSAAIANTYSDAYLTFNRQTKVDSIRRANGLLDEQIAPLKDRVGRAESSVEQFRQKKGLVSSHASNIHRDFEGGETVADQQLNEVDTQLTLASGDVAQKQATLRALQTAVKSAGGDAIPQVVTSPLIQGLRQQEAELSSKEAALEETTLGDNPALMAARAGSMRVRERIAAEVSKIATSLSNELTTAQAQQKTLQQRLMQLQQQVATQSEANVSLVQLESEAQAARVVYQGYLSRYEQTSIQAALQEPEADLVSPAQAPVSKSGPAVTQLSILVLLGAATVACSLALLAERRQRGMRTAGQMQAQTGLYTLGFLPKARNNVRRVVGSGKRTTYTEAVSLVNSLLQFGDARYRARVVLVTSANSQEGKTFLAASLAAGIGQDGGRALLIDCDVRRPSVAKALKLDMTPMPAEASWAGSASHLWQSVLPGLDVMTMSPLVGQRHTLDSAYIKTLIENVRNKYDLVVLDAPPVLAFSDASVLSLYVDGTILAVRWGRTSSRAVSDAIKALNAYKARILGAAITQVDVGSLTDADGSHAQVYRNYASYFA